MVRQAHHDGHTELVEVYFNNEKFSGKNITLT